jgi:hypothetical protein
MNKLILLCVLLTMVGCTPKASQLDFPVLPDGLKDCKFFYLQDGSGTNITVARCPNSTTSVVSGGKHKRTSITAEGEK